MMFSAFSFFMFWDNRNRVGLPARGEQTHKWNLWRWFSCGWVRSVSWLNISRCCVSTLTWHLLSHTLKQTTGPEDGKWQKPWLYVTRTSGGWEGIYDDAPLRGPSHSLLLPLPLWGSHSLSEGWVTIKRHRFTSQEHSLSISNDGLTMVCIWSHNWILRVAHGFLTGRF